MGLLKRVVTSVLEAGSPVWATPYMERKQAEIWQWNEKVGEKRG